MNNKDNMILMAISIMVLAGAIAAGLGQVALGNSHGDNFPLIFGSGVMVVGGILFVIILFKKMWLDL